MGSSAGMYLFLQCERFHETRGVGHTGLPICEEGQHGRIDSAGEEDCHARFTAVFPGQN